MSIEKLVVRGLTTLELKKEAIKYAESLGYKSDNEWNSAMMASEAITYMKLNHKRRFYEFHSHDCDGEVISIDNLREISESVVAKEKCYPKEMMVSVEGLRARKRVVVCEVNGRYSAVQNCTDMEGFNELVKDQVQLSLINWETAYDAFAVSKKEIADAFGCKVEQLSIEG